jgi:23S rRNA (guanosine2251-2'-O)-methyltransferase
VKKNEMIYGTRAVIEAMKAGQSIEKVMIQSGLNNELIRELINAAKEYRIPIISVPKEKLQRLSTKNHQGVICFVSSISYASLDNLIHQAYSEGREPFLLIIDRITDVRNFGAIVRTAECAGVDGIVIPEREHAPLSSDAMKTSAGALNHVPIAREKDLRTTIKFLHDNGLKVIACTEKAATEIFDISLHGPLALILGSEEDGIDERLLRESDELAKIPMKGKINSLNVSVAAGIAMYEAVRQKKGAT